MLAEHNFVTTLGGAEAMSAAAGFLQGLGFEVTSYGPEGLQAVRARKRATSARVRLCPQEVRLVFDRGRVTVAAGIAPRGGKEKPAHAQLVTALARGLEALLVHRLPPDHAAADWRRAEAATDKAARRATWVAVALVVLSLVVIVLAVVVAVVATS